MKPPDIVVYETKTPPNPDERHVAFFVGVSKATKKREESKFLLPLRFMAPTESQARAIAAKWWVDEQARLKAREERYKAVSRAKKRGLTKKPKV